MSKITVRHPHNLSLAVARERINAFEQTLQKFGASLVWSDNKAEVKGFGVTGSAELGEGFVEVCLNLGLMAKAAGIDAVRLEGSIAKRLAAAFAEETSEAEE